MFLSARDHHQTKAISHKSQLVNFVHSWCGVQESNG